MSIKEHKTLYLWDLAGTIFLEEWDEQKTGFPDVVAWIENHLGKKRSEMTDLEFEQAHEIPYREGLYRLRLQPDFQKVLSWTKHNETFSTGNREQVAWRAAYLEPRLNFKIADYFQALNSVFDYGETNKKTKDMLLAYLRTKYNEGYTTVVYTDDKKGNVDFFKEAAEALKREKGGAFEYRLYHILNDSGGLRSRGDYWEIGSLSDLLEHEKKIT